MLFQKYFYTLDEVSEKLGCSIDDLFLAAKLGRITLSFDLDLIRTEIKALDMPVTFNFELFGKPIAECPDSFRAYAAGYEAFSEYRKARNETYPDPSVRLFSVTPEQIFLLLKHGFFELKEHNDKEAEISFEVIKTKADARYPKIKFSDILICKAMYNALIKRHDDVVIDTSHDSSFYIHEDAMSNKAFVLFSLINEVWPIPDSMNKPTEKQLIEFIDAKGYVLNDAEKKAIIKVSTPDNLILGGKQSNNKSDFQFKFNRNK